MMNSRKGITPVIALVLLLMMTVAAAGMAYVWFMSVQEETQTTVQESLSQRTDQMAGAVTIDAVYEDSFGVPQVLIRNTGSVVFTSDVVVYVGTTPCATVEVNALTSSGVSDCTGALPAVVLSDGLIIRAIPPKGAAVQIACNYRAAASGDYCVI